MTYNPQSEHLMRRKPAPRPFVLTSAVMSVSEDTLQMTADVLRSFGRVEACCIWYGRDRGAGDSDVSAIVVPAQRGTWGNYDVPGPSLVAASNITRPLGLVSLAQIHSHPSALVEHSTYDDLRAISRSMLSLVYPHYGNWNARFPKAIGVHEFQSDYWHTLSDQDASRRIRQKPMTAPRLIDLR